MMRLTVLLLIAINLIACTAIKKSADPQNIQEKTEYSSIKDPLERLLELSCGTFVAYAETASEMKEIWNVTGQDSVILLSRRIKINGSSSEWIISYEFMTSLPNTPTYTSLKEYRHREEGDIITNYFNINKKLVLKDILNKDFLENKINYDELKMLDKVVIHQSSGDVEFKGYSKKYEDAKCKCLRQNIYTIDPTKYEVSADFYDKMQGKKISFPNRPNLMIRRNISNELLHEISRKVYNVE